MSCASGRRPLGLVALLVLAGACTRSPPAAPAPAPTQATPTPTQATPAPASASTAAVPPAPPALPRTTEAEEAAAPDVEDIEEEPSLEELACQTTVEERLPLTHPIPAAEWLADAETCLAAARPADAVAFLDRALAADPTLALAHLRRAQAQALLRQDGGACAHDATLDGILAGLRAALAHDPALRTQLGDDPALADLRALPGFRILTGADPRTREGTVQALAGTTLYAPAMGAFGHLRWVELDRSSAPPQLGPTAARATLTQRTVGAAGTATDAESPATWAVDETGLLLLDPDGALPGPEVQRLRLDGRGDLREAGAGDGIPAWLGRPDECSA